MRLVLVETITEFEALFAQTGQNSGEFNESIWTIYCPKCVIRQGKYDLLHWHEEKQQYKQWT